MCNKHLRVRVTDGSPKPPVDPRSVGLVPQGHKLLSSKLESIVELVRWAEQEDETVQVHADQMLVVHVLPLVTQVWGGDEDNPTLEKCDV